ncbi:alpha/beta fold hydrolase [Actinomadura rudentiformis]|uniref:Alpha/beta hydrolase n=1 Tax=Actinomadura rudentiformis TaxID=359158 RepID=A0A6H9YGQ7_9ACTN|nr:alpha/beta fold hydrolase [Actinomadura rudentiformis]KAB2339615.1 alpha/beta hydrolase [Actinomadura rudentiformis]
MTTFVLVHGAWHGPWTWDRVVPLLEREGAKTIAPDLTHAADAGLRTHVDEVVSVLDAAGDVVLAGHSYGALVAREAADLRPGRVKHIVMIEGWAGADGMSLFDLAPEGFVEAIRSWAGPDGEIPAPAPERFGITDPEDARWLAERLRPQFLRTFTEATRLSGAVGTIPGTGIFCRPQVLPFERMAVSLGYRAIGLDAPHDVPLTDPRPVADGLLEAAG